MLTQLIASAKNAHRDTLHDAPLEFCGSIGVLYSRHLDPNLITPERMAQAHRVLRDYVNGVDPLVLVRAVAGQTRGDISVIKAGRFRATDNAPSWMMHYLLFNEVPLPSADALEPLFTVWPCHLFEIAKLKLPTLNTAGWHIAHLADVKDRNTDWQNWSRAELRRRFIRNVHPCNYVPLPKTDWQRLGSNRQVLGYLAGAYRERYSDVWSEFLDVAEIRSDIEHGANSNFHYQFAGATASSVAFGVRAAPQLPPRAAGVVRYAATRLLFKARVIEALGPDDGFEVETPEGVFQFTKRSFYEAFPGVVRSKSYTENGVYHYPTTPAVARQFLRSSS